jgi:hypothetical protein
MEVQWCKYSSRILLDYALLGFGNTLTIRTFSSDQAPGFLLVQYSGSDGSYSVAGDKMLLRHRIHRKNTAAAWSLSYRSYTTGTLYV